MPAENLAGRSVAEYRLLKRIGEGGTATVYRADHVERGPCAVKILREKSRKDPIAVKRFLREARFGSRVVHDNVVRTYDYGEEKGLHYLALEWASGEPLTDFARRSGPADAALAARIIHQLADGLAAAHTQGIIHRDLKPENIIFDPDTGQAKLLDFGIARDAEDDPAERLTRTGFFVGSLNYVAPEALSGELVGEAADIYSLATITYFLLSGEHPHNGRSPREVFQQLLTQEARPLRETTRGGRVSEAVAAVVMKSLSRDPAARHGSVGAFADDLVRASEGAEAPGPVGDGSDRGLLGSIRSIFGKKKGSK
jgi:serine/threonine-protein kinase